MDPRTLELFRCLQSGPYDESGWKQIQRLLSGQCRVLRGRNDFATLAEIVQLLEAWATAAGSGRLRAAALGEAAEIAERELRQISLAEDLRARAVHNARASLDSSFGVSGMTSGAVTLAVEQVGDHELDEAIAACEAALDVEATPANVQALADLYARRGTPEDAEQAAELYVTLGDVLGNPDGIGVLKRALELVPGHSDAEALLARYTAEIRASVPAITLNVPAAAAAASRGRHSTLQGAPSPAPPLLAADDPGLFSAITRQATPSLAPSALSPSPSLGMKTIVGTGPNAVQAALAHGAALHSSPPSPLSAFATGAQPSMGIATAVRQAPPPLTASALRAAPEPPPLTAAGASGLPGAKPATGQRAPVMVLQLPSNSSGPPLRVVPVSSLSPVVFDDAESIAAPKRGYKRVLRPLALAGIGLAAAAAALVMVRTPGWIARTPDGSTHAAGQLEAKPPLPAPRAEPAPAPTPQPTAAAPEPAATTPEPAAARPVAPEAAAPKPAPKPSVELQLDQVALHGGKLNPLLVAAAIEKTQPKLEACYAQTLEKKPHLRGKLLFGFTIKPNGRASIVKMAGGTIKDVALIQCSADVISNVKYPKPQKQAVKVKLPLQYKPS